MAAPQEGAAPVCSAVALAQAVKAHQARAGAARSAARGRAAPGARAGEQQAAQADAPAARVKGAVGQQAVVGQQREQQRLPAGGQRVAGRRPPEALHAQLADRRGSDGRRRAGACARLTWPSASAQAACLLCCATQSQK